MRQMRKKRRFQHGDRGQFPCFACPCCDTPIGLWEQSEGDGVWIAPCGGCGAAAAFFEPSDPDVRVYLR